MHLTAGVVAGVVILIMARFTHTGEVLGWPGQTIAGLPTLRGSVLVYSGPATALRRLAAPLPFRSGPRPPRFPCGLDSPHGPGTASVAGLPGTATY